MGHDVMTGMLWAAAMMVGVPLAIGIGVLVMILRRRGRDTGPLSNGRV